MNPRVKVVLLVVTLTLLSAVLMGLAPQNQYPPGSGGSSSCTYCSSDNCGCDPPQVGCTLHFSCGCSSIDCNHTCSYTC
jgi:hypothetical protein